MSPTAERPATARQLRYLKALAERAGQTFTTPRSSAQASREIQRLKAVRPSSRAERRLEREDWEAEAAAREANCDVPIASEELTGYGSSATWRKRS